MKHILLLSFLLLFINGFCQEAKNVALDIPLLEGIEYKHEAVKQYDFAKKPHGYWLFVPDQPRPAKSDVVVFMHGYGGYNPMIYGKWIKHLVQQGKTVIYPRYQRNLFLPSPKKFGKNASKGIVDALQELQNGDYPEPNIDNFSYIGHSYGGVISSFLSANFQKYELPKPKVLMMCSPGTAIFKGGRLDSYESLPEDLKLIILTSVHDDVVGDEFAWLVYNTATNTPDRNLLRQFPDAHKAERIRAGHNESYCIDQEFDTGLRNVTTKRALRISELNAIDFYGYWKLYDAAYSCVVKGQHCDVALGNTAKQKYLGAWADGSPIRQLEVFVPAPESAQNK